MQSKLKYFLLVIIMTIISLPAFSWSKKGHDIVAVIADANLEPKVRETITKLLNGHSIIYYSSWMDNMQNLPEWRKEYERTKTWHYGNVDLGYTYETMPKCETGDVYTATEEIVKKLKTGKLSVEDETYYLKMLIHLIGDMHCPMHAGRLSDKGGNFFEVSWFNYPTNLHKVWDEKMVETAHKWSYTEWKENLDIYNKQQKDSIASGNLYEWYINTTKLSRQIYSEVQPKIKLSYDYVVQHTPMLEEQLLNAGYRLARILNEIYK